MLNVEQGTATERSQANPRAHWPEPLRREFEANEYNGCVGSVLVSETDKLRVWHLRIPPGKRCNFHRHVNAYFWTAHKAGKARGYYHDGRIVDVTHYEGETKHFTFGPGEFFAHSVENIGDADLLFTTVEFIDGPNEPLPVPDDVRLEKPA
jgi:hypothetical protein